MKMNNKLALLPGVIIIVLGILIIPVISSVFFGDYVCGHSNMNIVGFAIIFIGIYVFIKEKNQ